MNADKYFNQSLKLEPGNLKALTGKAMLVFEIQVILKQQSNSAEKIVIDSPSSVEGWLVKATIAVLKLNLDEALRHYQHVLLLDPYHFTAAIRTASLLLRTLQQYEGRQSNLFSHYKNKFSWDPSFSLFSGVGVFSAW